MKKSIIYIGLAVIVGLFAGYLLFGGGNSGDRGITEHDHAEDASSDQMWTCSMHPQIMQPEPGDCPICGMDLIPAEAGADGLAANAFKMTQNALALANIQTTMVGMNELEGSVLKLSGKIRENEDANAVQVTYFSGRIEKLNVSSTGEKVYKGQLLATVYSPELVSAQQELLTTLSLKESQPELYKAVRQKLKLWKLSEKQINGIEASGEIKENFPVYATVSGTVIEKMVEEGDYIKLGQPLYKISNLNSIWAVFDAYENQFSNIKVGQNVKVTTTAYPDKTFDAKVSFIDPILNASTRTVMIRTVLNNTSDLFKPGMFVEGEIEIKRSAKNKESIVIPSSAVMWTGERSIVYVKTNPNEPVFEMREVILGNSTNSTYTVISGLNNGEEIVANGTFTVDAAAQLQGKKSMMNQDGGTTMTGHEGHLGLDNESSNNAGDSINHAEMNKRIEVSKDFQNQLKKVFDSYLLLKDALVVDNGEDANEKATELVQSIAKVDMKLLPDDNAHNHWMTIEKEITLSAKSIANTSEISIQRKHFKHLSAHVLSGVQLFGINQKVYAQFCPMADNDNGAYWLSMEEGIKNPYFGDAMLKCGEVKGVIE